MDFRILIAVALAALLAIFNIRAQRSGVVATRSIAIRRSNMPRMFTAFLVMRWCAVCMFVGIALVVAVGLVPISN